MEAVVIAITMIKTGSYHNSAIVPLSWFIARSTCVVRQDKFKPCFTKYLIYAQQEKTVDSELLKPKWPILVDRSTHSLSEILRKFLGIYATMGNV